MLGNSSSSCSSTQPATTIGGGDSAGGAGGGGGGGGPRAGSHFGVIFFVILVSFFVILESFFCHFGVIFLSFWSHFFVIFGVIFFCPRAGTCAVSLVIFVSFADPSAVECDLVLHLLLVLPSRGNSCCKARSQLSAIAAFLLFRTYGFPELSCNPTVSYNPTTFDMP